MNSRRPEYFYQHGEEPARGREDPDRLSFYRVLARLNIEDPTKYESIRSRVLQHYAGAFIDTAHPSNSQYKTFDALYIPSTTTTFFDALLHPDLALRPYGGNGIQSEQVLLVICNALSFRIIIRKEHYAYEYQEGHEGAPECNVKFEVLEKGTCEHRCTSLGAADDGRALVELLEQRTQDFEQRKHCWNEYAAVASSDRPLFPTHY